MKLIRISSSFVEPAGQWCTRADFDPEYSVSVFAPTELESYDRMLEWLASQPLDPQRGFPFFKGP